jgi:Putative Ig domain
MSFSQHAARGSGAMYPCPPSYITRAASFIKWATASIFVVVGAFAHAATSIPSISGTPSPIALATSPYLFAPHAVGAGDGTLRFSITNKPSWAQFDPLTGRLYGTPTQQQVGIDTKNIVISAIADGRTASLAPFELKVVASLTGGGGVGVIERPPVISGTPSGSATVGQSYVFHPSASDPNGDKLAFAIQNKPTWAAFSTTTGALTGTPTQAGTFSNIVISVSDGSESAALAGFAIQVAAAGSSPPPVSPPPVSPPPVAGPNCGMRLGGAVTFCETFDRPAGIGNRSGDLDGNVWGVSRTIGDGVNIGQAWYDAWPPTQINTCNGTQTVHAPNDVIICNGQLREAVNDNPSGQFEAGTVTALAMYPKQPFDFAGRTGTVSFDVSNDSHGFHAAWPELWVSNLPVPAPFNHFNSWMALPQHGFGVRFSAVVGPGQYGLCPNGNNMSSRRWTVDSGVVVRNFTYQDVDYQGVDFASTTTLFSPSAASPTLPKLNILDCVTSPADGSGVMNHVEVRVSQNQIDVYATDAGVAPTAATLKHIASLTNVNLTLTRGLVWLEDVHYNADKGLPPSQKQHTFVWDNVAFDGPFTARDFSYDALDANQAGPAYNALNLGKLAQANQTATWDVPNLPANPQAGGVRVLFNFTEGFNPVPKVLNVTVNGHAHPTPWPFPDSVTNTWRTYAVTIPITDLVPGTNVVQLGADQQLITANVNIVLAEVPGAVPVLPGNSRTYPGAN